MPKYSIVVPTSDRAHLLGDTLEALARLDHEDFEVIVSNNFSSDRTEEVVRGRIAQDARFRYVKTDSKLAMSDHWEFALGFVTGDYFLYVGDDDTFDRNILRVLDYHLERGGAEGIYWRQAVYYYKAWFQPEHAGKLYIPPYSGRKWTVPSATAIRETFDMNFNGAFPFGTSFCFKSSVVRAVRERYGAFFLRPFPDYTSTLMYLPSIREFLHIDLSLSIMGKSSDSNSAAYRSGPKERKQSFINEHRGNMYPHMPLHYHLVFNGEVENVRAVQEIRSEELSGYSFDWAKYFCTVYDLRELGLEVHENEEGRHEFWRVLPRMPLGVQRRVLGHVLSKRKDRLRHSLRYRLLGKRMPPGRNEHADHLGMEVAGIVECSEKLAEHNARLGYY